MTNIHRVVSEIVPPMYADIAADLNMPLGTNVAASNQCHVLSKGLWIALKNRDIEARREFHQAPNDDWHFLIAHTPLDAEPSEDDIITDLNPWQFDKNQGNSFLHGTRGEVMAAMEQRGASSHARSLRNLSTLVVAHTVAIYPTEISTS